MSNWPNAATCSGSRQDFRQSNNSQTLDDFRYLEARQVTEPGIGRRRVLLLVLFVALATVVNSASAAEPGLQIDWEKNYLTIRGRFPGSEIPIHYLEAYCRPGSTDRDWHETVIGHTAVKTSKARDGKVIMLQDRLKDGVVVDHTITAGQDEIDFKITARNPTEETSLAHWAQPCIRVDKFTGTTRADARELVPAYARKSFIFLDDKLTRLPTKPWADKARYIPGQVYCPKEIDRNDVNPRPLSKLVPSNGMMGCYSHDEKMIFAVVFEPYQELFQGVICCIHNDFRIGGLRPGERKTIRGKIYIVPADADALMTRYRNDFPEHFKK